MFGSAYFGQNYFAQAGAANNEPVDDPNGTVITPFAQDRSIIVAQDDRSIVPFTQDRTILVEERDV